VPGNQVPGTIGEHRNLLALSAAKTVQSGARHQWRHFKNQQSSLDNHQSTARMQSGAWHPVNRVMFASVQ
jgi:hypothetical protein